MSREQPFNRTIVELKYHLFRLEISEKILLIVP